MKTGASLAFGGILAISACVIELRAQDETQRLRTWAIDQRLHVSSSSLGQIMKFNTNWSLDLSKNVGLDAGIPFYVVNYSAVEPTTSSVSHRGVGNVYADLRLSFSGSALNYVSTVTATAPTGDREKGLSTGAPTVDWNNGFYRGFAHRVAPYANIGIANTISDTPFFLRPFSSKGLVGHFEAGTTVSISRALAIGGSGYSVVPAGEQTIVSKIVEVHTEPGTPRTLPANSHGRGLGLSKTSPPDRVFETTREIVGTADLSSDYGFSTWMGIGPFKGVDFTIGYSRSTRYRLDTLFFGTGLRIGPFGSKAKR